MTIRYQQEFLETCLDELKDLITFHWEEIALNKDHIKLNPDWDRYLELESLGILKVFTARLDSKLIGYFVVFVSKHIHYKDHLFASNDVLFLKQEYRKCMTGVNLIKFAESCLKEDGVSVLTINTKVHKPFDVIMDKMGFDLVERVYSKYLQN